MGFAVMSACTQGGCSDTFQRVVTICLFRATENASANLEKELLQIHSVGDPNQHGNDVVFNDEGAIGVALLRQIPQGSNNLNEGGLSAVSNECEMVLCGPDSRTPPQENTGRELLQTPGYHPRVPGPSPVCVRESYYVQETHQVAQRTRTLPTDALVRTRTPDDSSNHRRGTNPDKTQPAVLLQCKIAHRAHHGPQHADVGCTKRSSPRCQDGQSRGSVQLQESLACKRRAR